MVVNKKNSFIISAGLLLMGLTLSLALTWQQHTRNQARIEEALASQSERLIELLLNRLASYEHAVRAARGVVLALQPDQLTRSRFRSYQMSRDISFEFPGARGFGFIRRVPVADEARFLADARNEGPLDFHINQLTPHSQERWVIQYIEPLRTNEPAVGLDIASEPRRKWAAEQAAMTGAARLTAPITLVQVTGITQRSFLLLLPIYLQPPSTVPRKVEDVLGWAYSPLIIDDILDKVDYAQEKLHLELTDITEHDTPVNFYSSPGSTSQTPNALQKTQEREVYGRKWLFCLVAQPDFIRGLNLSPPLTTFLIGLLLSTSATGLVLSYLLSQVREMQRREEKERILQQFNATLECQVSERTQALDAARHDLQTILDALPSMVGYWDTQLHNRFANRAYCEWFGVEPARLPGTHIRDLLGSELFERNLPYMQAALQGHAQTFERAIPRPDGQGMRYSLAYYLPDNVDGEIRGFYVLVHDVTELRENREKLSTLVRENEALLATIKASSIYSVTDSKGRIIEVNDNFLDISGYTREELLGQNHRIINSGYHTTGFWRGMWYTIMAGKAWRGEICNRKKSGETYWVDTIIAPFLGSSGQLEKVISIRNDITDSKLTAQQLALERERLDNILRGTNVGTWEWNVQTGETRFNERWAEIIGYSLHELEPVNIDTWVQHAHAEDLLLSNDSLQRHFSGELSFYETECRMRHREGHWVWVLDRGRVTTWTPDGKPEWMYGTHQDITRSKNAQRRLTENEAFLASAGRIASIGAWRYDTATGELFWARETRQLLEVDENTTITLQEALSFCLPEKRATLETCIQTAILQGTSWDIELPCQTARGRHVWMRIIGEAEQNNQGQVLLQGVYQDITEAHYRRETNDSLQREKAAAEAANDAKSQFLANMSHEIRTPLNAVIGLSFLLEKTRLDHQQKDLLGKIRVASDNLLGLINDVLDLSKIEAHQMVLESVPFKLNDLLRELRQLMTAHAESKQLDLIIHPAQGLPALLRGDVTRIKQVLMNLLNNAIKFTEQGHVKLSVWSTQATHCECWLHFSVQDTGIGIPRESQANLFKPFTQADASTTRRFGGSGLGLSIVKRLTELMGGHLGFSSTEGGGSEFWVEFPLQLDLPEYANTVLRKEQVEILLVSPDNGFCQHVADIADALGWSITTANSLEKGIAHLHQAGISGLSFNAVISDTQTLASCMHWHTENAFKPLYSRMGPVSTPLWIALSPSSAGAHPPGLYDGEISVEASTLTLFNSVSLAARKRYGNSLPILDATPATIDGIGWLKGVRILVVDDSDLNRDVALRILEREGACVDLAENGQLAIDHLNGGSPLPDLILMDVQMPVLDGIEATRRIKNNAALCPIPIIALTAGALVAERQQAIEAGMSAFIIKPLDPTHLVRLLRQTLEASIRPFVPVALPSTTHDATTRPEDWPILNGIDHLHAMRMFNRDLTMYKRILRGFLREYEYLEAIDTTRMKRTVRLDLAARLHKLRGGAALLGAKAVNAQTRLLEHSLRSECANHKEIRDNMAALLAAYSALKHDAEPLLNIMAPPRPAAVKSLLPCDLKPADRFGIHKLRDLLKQQDLQALTLFDQLSESLHAVLGERDFIAFRNSVEQLDFAAALTVLTQHALA